MNAMMSFYTKAKSKEFWKSVRTDPAYGFILEELFEEYEKCAKEEIAVLSYDLYMEYYRNGSRETFEHKNYHPRRNRVCVCALLSLIYPENEEYFDNLMNTIWAVCDEYSWALPAHIPDGETAYKPYHIDLFSAETASGLSEIRYFLGDRMGKLMNERIHQEIQKRVIDSFLGNTFRWENWKNNWAAVCASNIACTFMYERPDLFWEIKPRIDKIMESFFEGYNADGVCREGLAYWQYGFGYYVNYAQRLLEYTNGNINLFEDERVKEIAQFPNKIFLDQQVTASFSDSSRTGRVGMGTMNVLRYHYGKMIPALPEEYCYRYHRTGRFMLHIDSIVWYEPKLKKTEYEEEAIYFMKESGWFIKKGTRYSFAAKGGDNKEPHNHNDLGSFIFSHGGRQILVDLGAGLYNRDYFGAKRYEILCNRSAGHSVPILDGYEQGAGEQYVSTMDFVDDVLKIDITSAYPKNQVTKAVREFSFTENGVILKDYFKYDLKNHKDELVRERFVTLIKPQIIGGVIKLDEISLIFDEKLWQLKISEGFHKEHADKEELTVYFIDFVSEECEAEFRVEILHGKEEI